MTADKSLPPSIASEWTSFTDTLAPLAEQIVPLMTDPDDPLLRHEMYRLIVGQLCMAYFSQVVGDARHPDFWPLYHQAFNIFGPNPDMYYFQAPIEGNGKYLFSGFRGTSLIVDVQVGGGQFYNTGVGAPAHSGRNYDLDELTFREDGWFEVMLSQNRPSDWTGDWWQIWPDTTNIHIRQICYDWLNEVDARFVVERLDVPPARPRDTVEGIRAKLDILPKWAENWIKVSQALIQEDREAGLINQFVVDPMAGTGGARAQMYVKGQFDLQPDEALIMETDLPETVKYWSFALNDLNYSIIEYVTRQSSLNGYQAAIDSDGRFRAVISAVDPGVPNWLDTSGYQKGAILGRWRNASSAPQPTTRLVKVADVRKYLPANTPVVTPEERDATLRIRSRGARLRRRW
jgi:hypothetical protein